MVKEVRKKEVVVLLPERIGIIPLKKMDWAHPVNKKRDARWIGKIKDARKVLKPGDVIEAKTGSGYVDNGAIPLSLWQEPAGQGALMLMEARTGFVRAMIGGYDHNKSKFNRAVQAKRQPGSSFKPLIYASAIDKGFTPATIVIDSPIIYNKALGQFKGWKPTNFEEKFFGPTTVREAMTHSRNVVTIKMLDKIGVGYAANFAARRFGIKAKLDRNLSLALGASPVSMLEMVTAYSTLANGGKRPSPIFITSIEDRKGNLLFHAEPQIKKVISPSTAYLTTNIMTGVVKRGTAVKVDRALKRPVAGKTGTTNNYIDAWFTGFTPDLVCSVWVGNDDNTSMGKRETGSRAAIPTWIAFMKNVLADRPIKDFDAPSDVIFVKIDRKSGKLARMGGGDKFFESFLDGTEPTEYETTGSTNTEERSDSVGF
jgi:penicillin-binding protein 1A